MADEIEVKVPDIGGVSGVEIIEIMVKPGDDISKDTSIITLESDKASMEIPAPLAGQVSKLCVKVGDMVSEGDVILRVVAQQTTPTAKEDLTSVEIPEAVRPAPQDKSHQKMNDAPQPQVIEVLVPDIGNATGVEVIDIMVKTGDCIDKDQPIITLEGEKATMDIPSPAAGIVEEVSVNVGDKVEQGSLILLLHCSDLAQTACAQTHAQDPQPEKPAKAIQQPEQDTDPNPGGEVAQALELPTTSSIVLSAGPAVRRLARELGVELRKVNGSGRKGRITKEDVQHFVKTRLSEKTAAMSVYSMPAAPVIDFSKFGAIEVKPLNKIKRLTGINVHRAWITIPHVTQFDEADITELEAFRKEEMENNKQARVKLTLLAFAVKVVSKALAAYPQFNASLDATGENLIYKQYVNIGIAVETSNGLVVPVIKQVNQLSVNEIANEMNQLSSKAREKGLMPADMSGGCFTISSLGGIGGTAFTPIVNSPEVAILGLSRTSIKPAYIKDKLEPRLMLPLSLSYDHRVIDGAEAARFTRYIAESLNDIRRIIL